MLYSCTIGWTLKTIHAILANLWGANIHTILELWVHKALTVHCGKSGINHHIHTCTMLKLYRYWCKCVFCNWEYSGPRATEIEGTLGKYSGPRVTERIGGTRGHREDWRDPGQIRKVGAIIKTVWEGLGEPSSENFELLHALKCVLVASEAPFCACIQFIHTCQLPIAVSDVIRQVSEVCLRAHACPLNYHKYGNFCCKNIFMVCVNNENKNTKYILQQIIIIASILFLYKWFHSTTSYNVVI